MAFSNGQNVQASDLNSFSVTTVTTTGVVTINDTTAGALDVAGGAQFGSGNVALIGIDGKINGPISTTIIDDLAGTNLTGIPILLKANSGTTTTTSAENVDTYAMASALTAKDTILVKICLEVVTQAVAGVFLYNSTDSVQVVDVTDQGGLGNLAAGRELIADSNVRQLQSAATEVMAMSRGHSDLNGQYSTGEKSTFTTAWTGAWTLALRQGGLVAGGTLRWSWAVYRLQGQ